MTDVVLHGSPEEFWAAAGDLLTADPVQHTLPLTVFDRARSDERALATLVTVHDDGPCGAALRVFPQVLVLSGTIAPAAESLAVLLGDADPALNGVTGPTAEADAFAAEWTRLTGAAVRTRRTLRLHRLVDLVEPVGASTPRPGTARRGTEDDVDLLARWRLEFATEVQVGGGQKTGLHDITLASLRRGDLHVLWEVDGTPLSWAVASAPVHGMSRVGPVYTPSAHRGNGCAAAVTAALSRRVLDAGTSHVVLFTDATNAVTNALYERIGYRVVDEFVEIEFVS
ncbi:GNAT family N-acetyltransferase [Umezawaea beigongshangensis]|uniref:GNAT family N-acetyltransferase n=1 Tax=Umezawaea beigongshangensis TaxID=2780383 RepID=UPI0018F13C58|nr:GNAT family N-acetyltransferase [Umezawaea beigongshangensis]